MRIKAFSPMRSTKNSSPAMIARMHSSTLMSKVLLSASFVPLTGSGRLILEDVQ